jgi:hypothetical protein
MKEQDRVVHACDDLGLLYIAVFLLVRRAIGY